MARQTEGPAEMDTPASPLPTEKEEAKIEAVGSLSPKKKEEEPAKLVLPSVSLHDPISEQLRKLADTTQSLVKDLDAAKKREARMQKELIKARKDLGVLQADSKLAKSEIENLAVQLQREQATTSYLQWHVMSIYSVLSTGGHQMAPMPMTPTNIAKEGAGFQPPPGAAGDAQLVTPKFSIPLMSSIPQKFDEGGTSQVKSGLLAAGIPGPITPPVLGDKPGPH